MSLNTQDRESIIKKAFEHGYRVNSDGTKLINRETGGTVRISETGGSVTINGTRYSSVSDANKSKHWR